jgi:hypothetical protein
MRPARHTARFYPEHERLNEVIPGQQNSVIIAFHGLGPERPAVAGLAKLSVNYRQAQVGEFREKQTLNFLLKPAGQGDIVRVDPHFAVYHIAFEEKHVARPSGG